ncbi:ferritin family protein [Streptomyces cellulosae]|uniref:Uncharacterized protein n=1 Tax=Streptomyces cellulosae TaxID=1968 RepID=A0ABW7YCQ8_STRCE
MAHTFEYLVKLEQAAVDAHARLNDLGVDCDKQWQAWWDASAASRPPSPNTPKPKASSGLRWRWL